MRKKRKSSRKVPGCKKMIGKEALAFLHSHSLLRPMLAKRDRHLENIPEGEETVMASIGTIVRYDNAYYVAHIYCIDNFEDLEVNGWVVHLWYVSLVNTKHTSYQQYMTQMSAELDTDLWDVGL